MTTLTSPASSGGAVRRSPWSTVGAQVVPGLAVAVAVAVALTALSGVETYARLGLPDPGLVVTYGLPVVRAVGEVAAVVTVGALLLAAFLVPPVDRTWLDTDGYRATRIAAGAGALWVVASLVMVPLATADAYGEPLSGVLSPVTLVETAPQIEGAGAWFLTAIAATVAAVLARSTLSWGWTVVAFGVSVAGLLPVALTGHSASGGSHDVASDSLVFHVVAASLWVGGLVVLVVHLVAGGGHATIAVRRFSRTALVAWVVMALSGTVNAFVRIGPGDLLTSTYGLLVLGKVAALLGLGAFGVWHRRRSVAAVAAGDRAGLVRSGALEILLMFATVGIAVALGRTPPPETPLVLPTRAEAIIGYPVDGPLTLGGVVTGSRFDLVLGTAAIVLAALYVAGVGRLRRRGDAWPVGRTLSWILGCATLLVATSSGIGRDAPAMLSVHMAQHMVLTVVVPILLLLGAPVTLLLRAVPAVGPEEPPGPREWVLAAVGSPLARALTRPLVALVLFVGSFALLYFTGLFDAAMRSHWAHLAMDLLLLLVGLLFFWPVVGVDPAPRRLSRPGRLAPLLVAVPSYALLGVAVTGRDQVIGGAYYAELGVPGIDRLADQSLAGVLAGAGGTIPMLVVLVALIARWSRRDERSTRREERRADRDLPDAATTPTPPGADREPVTGAPPGG